MTITHNDTDIAVFQEHTSPLSSTTAPGEIVMGSLAGINAQSQPLNHADGVIRLLGSTVR